MKNEGDRMALYLVILTILLAYIFINWWDDIQFMLLDL